ncbi:uncharacterized protein KQ657_000582 [Scheffersomyces spartinae]|uniref:NADP-dependent oxidoreductase domain-containing protein n=1 Tax=Scheffersomyces spartinae TaxID=45513 RepID=A0A9P8AI99_9ASCO|nr:uncharacterized protein KQ657_000582 [Scheffersomyces spartinae]KAG7193515.1 hypothetical protein KQ657_000582 [Scheffersomyces spartinae]
MSSLAKAIGPRAVVLPYSIGNLPKLIIGGAVFNTQYHEDPLKLPVTAMLKKAFLLGANAIDTSPYYGPSEEILGKALKQLAAEEGITRDQYYICTKAGRLQLDDFDYSRAWVRQSVERSMERLGTNYIDLVYMHDIEFVEEPQIFEALKELKLLKNEGKIRNFGISGYPVDLLLKVSTQCVTEPEIGQLDAILSYSHGCLQNTSLFAKADEFFTDAKLTKLLNGSILSMSLLRSGKTHNFHPASNDLKQAVYEVAQTLKREDGVELADLATRFALKRWLFEGPQASANKTSIVLGVSDLEELDAALDSYWRVANGVDVEKDEQLFAKVQKLLGPHLNETWKSGLY